MRTFHTKVGWWYWMIIIILSSSLFVTFWFHELLLALVFAIAVVYSIEGMIHTQYIITSDGMLRIECGRFSKKTAPIPVSQITDIAKSKSWEAAPALSLDRLKISYRKGTIKTYALISPQNAEAFVRCLKKQNDSINVSI